MTATTKIFGHRFCFQILPGTPMTEEETLEWYRVRIQSLGMEGTDEEVARARAEIGDPPRILKPQAQE